MTSAIRRGRKYDVPIMLHGVRSDPRQEANLAGERPGMVGELTALMEERCNEGIYPEF